jgi:ketosteroid isomerase-like protein
MRHAVGDTPILSAENVETIRAMLGAWSSGDLELARAVLHPDIEWYDPPEMADSPPVYRGRAGVEASMRNWVGTWEDFRYDPQDVIDAGDKVLVVGRQSGRGKGSDVEVAGDLFHVWTVRDGLAVEMHMFTNREQAFEAAGLHS